LIAFAIGGAATLTSGIFDVLTNGVNVYLSHFFVTGVVLFFVAIGLILIGKQKQEINIH
jgi:hypothetical protein